MPDAPCPFCGNSTIRRSTLLPGRGFCENCGAEGPWSPAFDGDWNTRAGLSEALLNELVDAAQEVMRISDRDHDAWYRLRAALCAVKGDEGADGGQP